MKTLQCNLQQEGANGYHRISTSLLKKGYFPTTSSQKKTTKKTKTFTNQKKPANSLQHVILQQSLPCPPTVNDFLANFNKKLCTRATLEQTHVGSIPNPQRSNPRNPKGIETFWSSARNPPLFFSPRRERASRFRIETPEKKTVSSSRQDQGSEKRGKNIQSVTKVETLERQEHQETRTVFSGRTRKWVFFSPFF